MVEEPVGKGPRINEGLSLGLSEGVLPVPITAVTTGKADRFHTGSAELDRVLGGGLLPGSLSLIVGDPGIGKSSLTLKVCAWVAAGTGPVLYVTGEESVQQVASRAKRLGIKNPRILISSETQIEDILSNIDPQKARLIVIDSIQTLSSVDIDSPVGGVVQIKAVVEKVRIFSKKYNIPSLLIAHVY